MKTLVIFAAALLCVQAHAVSKLKTTSSKSSEEEYRVILPAGDKRPISLEGVGAGDSPPDLKSVEVKVPSDAKPSTKQQLISEALTARGIDSEAQKKVLVVRDRRQAPVTSAANKQNTNVTNAAGERASSTEKGIPATGRLEKARAMIARLNSRH